MNIIIVYDSQTGTTAKAAEAMGKTLTAQGHSCRVQTISDAKPEQVAEADLICVGSWVQGLFVVMQHPTAGMMNFIEKLPNLNGKRAVVFCTYKIATGSTLKKMTSALEQKGASVVGQFQYRGPEPDSRFTQFAASLK